MRKSGVFPALIALAFASCVAAAAPDAKRGLRFNSPGVLDLAKRSLQIDGGKPVAVAALSDEDAQHIFAEPTAGEDPLPLAFSDDLFGCKTASPKCSREHERKLLDLAGSSARRDGKQLSITPVSGAVVKFVDWTEPTTQTGDGDAETHWYLGRLGGSGYARVEVEFGHDAPGNFLINLQNGKSLFVHNAADLAAPSPDGRLLVSYNALNPPLSLRVAALDGEGPRLALQCQVPEGGARLAPVFKGWHDATSFDLVVEIGEQSKSMQRLALRASHDGGHWRLAASDNARMDTIRLVCFE